METPAGGRALASRSESEVRRRARENHVLDTDGLPLPHAARSPIEGAPQLAVSSVWRLAVERWVEATP